MREGWVKQRYSHVWCVNGRPKASVFWNGTCWTSTAHMLTFNPVSGDDLEEVKAGVLAQLLERELSR
jgi:hypothetical protein